MPAPAEVRHFTSLLDIADAAALRLGDRRVLALRTDDGLEYEWSARELVRRGKLAAWRLRAAGIGRGDRLLVWSPSTPEIAALFFGAMRAGVVLVPIDLRMTPEIVARIAASADTRWLVIGTGPDAPDPDAAGLGALDRFLLPQFTAEPDSSFAADWEAQVDAWQRPDRSELFLITYTSGTTGHPRGVRLTHGNMLATIEAARNAYPPWPHRIVSLLPLSHGFGQVELLYVLNMGGQILYIRSRSPRTMFEAMREQRMTTMNVVPQLLDIFWSAIVREVEAAGRTTTFERMRRISRRLPYWARRLIFRRLHQRLGGSLRMFASGAAYLPPTLQQAWQDLGIVVIQAYGTTECGLAAVTSYRDHPVGRVGRAMPPVSVELGADGEILVSGPTVSAGYWGEPAGIGGLVDDRGRYHTGDIGKLDDAGNLTLLGRKKNIIVLANGLKVYPEDIENALRAAGLRDSVVLEAMPGRIEAVVLDPGRPDGPPGADPVPVSISAADEQRIHVRIEAAVRAANASLTVHERVDAWRLWPHSDFPRTHTLKIRRDPVREWAIRSAGIPLPVREGVAAED